MADKPDFTEGSIVEDTESSGTGGSTGPSIPAIDESVAQFVIDAIQQKEGLIEIPAFADDAEPLPDTYVDYYGFEDVDTMSVEDIFGQDWEKYDYIGTPPVVESDSLTEEEKEQLTDDQLYKADGDEKKYVVKPEYAEDFDGAEVLKGGTTPISKAINGRFSEMVVDAFGQDSKISVGKGKARNHDGNKVEAQKYVAFWVSDSDTAALQREKARMQAGEISESEFHEWAEANGHSDDI